MFLNTGSYDFVTFLVHRETLISQRFKKKSVTLSPFTLLVITVFCSKSAADAANLSVYTRGAQEWHIVSLLADGTSPTTVAHYVSMTSDLRVLSTGKH